jgi:hypothetical protein
MFGSGLIDLAGEFHSLTYPIIRHPTLDVTMLDDEAVLVSSNVAKTSQQKADIEPPTWCGRRFVHAPRYTQSIHMRCSNMHLSRAC